MNVHQDYIRAVPGNFSDPFFGRGTIKHATKSRRAIDPLAKQLSHDRVVLDDCDGGRHTVVRMGSRIRRTTVVPAPGEEMISQWPSRFCNRLRRFVNPLPARRSPASKPAPLSLMEICIRFSDTPTRNTISVAPEWRIALLRDSFTARNRWWRSSPGTLCSGNAFGICTRQVTLEAASNSSA